MSKIISIINEKGGTGKTTVAANIATALHRRGQKVILVDADPQGSARDWRSASPVGANLPDVIALDRPAMLSAIKNFDADYVVIDTPAKAEGMVAGCIRVSDVAILVIRPSGLDVWASAAAVKLVRQKIDVGGKIEAGFLVNCVSATTTLSKSIKSGEWNAYAIDQMTSTIGQRAAFASSMTDGVSVYDTHDYTARAEVDAVLNELEAASWL